MTYLLDTNIVSEIQRIDPNAGVETFLKNVMASQLYISAITIAEISYGINWLPKGKKKVSLQKNFEKILARFSKRTIYFDDEAASVYGKIMAEREKDGFNDDAFDTMLTAQASVLGLTIVTRNEKHFTDKGVKILNPFS